MTHTATAATSLQICLATGFGLQDTNIKKPGVNYKTLTAQDLLHMKHTTVPKPQAQWFLCSNYIAHDAREHDIQAEKGRFYLLTADLDKGNVDGPRLGKAVDEFTGSATRRIHTTSNSVEGDRRWRVIIPMLTPESFETWEALQVALMKHLAAALSVDLDMTVMRAGQVMFCPNSMPDKPETINKQPIISNSLRETHLFDWRDSPAEEMVINVLVDLDNQAKAAERSRDEARRRMAQRRAAGQADASVIDQFNATHRLETVMDACGYKSGPRQGWRSPNQTTTSFATKVFDEPAGQFWVSHSGSDLAAGLGARSSRGACYGDAFDLWCFFNHGNDRSQAIKAAAEMLGIERKMEPTAADRLAAMVRSAPTFPPIAAPALSDLADDITDAIDTSQKALPAPESATPQADAPRLLQFVQASHLPNWEPPRELIEGILTESAMSVIYGDSNTGKSFLVLDMAAHISVGRDWFGRRVQQGAVLYLAAESPRSIADRSRALATKMGCQLDHLFITQSSIDLYDPDGDALAAVETVRAIEKRYGCRIKLIVVDTLARAMAGGDENKTQDMGQLVKHIDLIKLASDAHIAIIHHTGKDATKGSRGSSALRAATDTEIEVSDPGEGQPREFKVTKQRDLGSKGEVFGFSLVTQMLGQGIFDNVMTTCYVAEAEVSKDPVDRLPPGCRMVMQAIRDSQTGGLRWPELLDQIVNTGQASKTTLSRSLNELQRRAMVYQEPTFKQYRIGSGKAIAGGDQEANDGVTGREF